MVQRQAFLNFDIRQPVNQWICFALLALMVFWVGLYYLVHQAEAFGDDYVNGSYDSLAIDS